jgi:hypothetical protein
LSAAQDGHIFTRRVCGFQGAVAKPGLGCPIPTVMQPPCTERIVTNRHETTRVGTSGRRHGVEQGPEVGQNETATGAGARERLDRQCVHVGLAKRVLLVELDRAVDLDHPPACLVREEVDADESPPTASAARIASSQASGVGSAGRRTASERDIRAPLAARRDPLDRSDDAAAGDHQPQVVAAGSGSAPGRAPRASGTKGGLECVKALA